MARSKTSQQPKDQAHFPDDYKLAYTLIGGRIKVARKRSKLTQKTLGELVGMTRANVANTERGRNRIHLDTIYKICAALDLKPHDVIPDAVEVSEKSKSAAQGMVKILDGLSDEEKTEAIARLLEIT